MPAVFQIRHTVFVEGQNVPEHEERDGLDDDARHYIVLDKDTPIGTARVLIDTDANTAKIGRVSLLEAHRSRGLGQQLMRYILDDLRNTGLASAKLGAQTHAIGFYAALGFTATGPEFIDAGIAHRSMVIDL